MTWGSESVTFNDKQVVALYNMEVTGQLSDGLYENWNAGNCAWWGDVSYGPENRSPVHLGRFNYSLKRIEKEMIEIGCDDRMTAYINSADQYCDITDPQQRYQFRSDVDTIMYAMQHGYRIAQGDYDKAFDLAVETLTHPEQSFYKVKMILNYYPDLPTAIHTIVPREFFNRQARIKLIGEVFEKMKACIAEIR